MTYLPPYAPWCTPPPYCDYIKHDLQKSDRYGYCIVQRLSQSPKSSNLLLNYRTHKTSSAGMKGVAFLGIRADADWTSVAVTTVNKHGLFWQRTAQKFKI